MLNTRSKIKEFFLKNKYEIAILLFTFLSLSQIINCAFISDDGIYYYLRGNIIYNGTKDIFHQAYMTMISWIQRGRFFPLSTYALFVMYYFNINILYKSLIIIAVCINVLMFGVFIEELTNSKRIKLIMMLFINIFFQVVTTYHSALLSFHLFMQVMFVILMLILIYLQRYFKTGKKSNLIISVSCFTIGLLTYELGFAYIGIVLFFILMYKKNIFKSLKTFVYYVIPLFIIGSINIIVKLKYAVQYEGVTLGVSIIEICKTGIKQCFAAWPLANYFASYKKGNILKYDFASIIKNITMQDIIIVVIFLLLLFLIIKNTEMKNIEVKTNEMKTTNIYNFYFLLFGLSFYIFPGVLSSLTEKYQKELSLGVAHISVYIQYFGLIMLFLWLFMIVYNKCKSMKSSLKILFQSIYICIAIFVLIMNQQNARLYINYANDYWKYPKDSIVNALKLNILNELNENDQLTVLTPYGWESNDFYSEFAKKKINYIPIQDLIHNEIINNKANKISDNIEDIYPANSYVVRYYGNKGEHEVFFGKILSIRVDSKTEAMINITVNKVKTLVNNGMSNYILYQSDDNGIAQNNILGLSELAGLITDGKSTVYEINNNDKIYINSISFLQNFTISQ